MFLPLDACLVGISNIAFYVIKRPSFLEGVWVTLSADFRGKGASPTNHCWCQSSRVIALSCGIKISAVHYLDLSQSMRVTDGQTDKSTTPKTALA